MALLIAGLILFLGPHSIRIFADGWRTKIIDDKGKKTWKIIYSLVSLAGLILVVYGFGESRANPVFLWNPPVWTRHAAALLVLVAFVLLTAADFPRNKIKQKLGHPMYLGVKTWAFVHLISNGRLGDVLLFGSFLVWAIAGFSAAKRRDRAQGTVYPEGSTQGTIGVVVVAFIAYGIFSMYLHRLLIGVPPF